MQALESPYFSIVALLVYAYCVAQAAAIMAHPRRIRLPAGRVVKPAQGTVDSERRAATAATFVVFALICIVVELVTLAATSSHEPAAIWVALALVVIAVAWAALVAVLFRKAEPPSSIGAPAAASERLRARGAASGTGAARGGSPAARSSAQRRSTQPKRSRRR